MAANRLLGGGFRLLAGLKVSHVSNRGSKGSMARPLLLHNEKIRDVIDTIGKKGVLLLGPPCHPVARIQRHALRHHVRVVTGRSGC